MRKVVFLLHETTPEAAASCEEACLRLHAGGVSASVSYTGRGEGTGSRADVYTEGRAESRADGMPQKTNPDTWDRTEDVLPDVDAGVLYLTDHAETLQQLSESGYAVIGLQHAGNTDMKFPGAKYIFSEPEEVDFDSYLKAYQRCRGIPWDVLETPRLRLRETTVGDVDRLYEIYAMPGMTDYMEGLFPDPADEKRYMGDYIKNVYGLMGFGVWSVIEKESGVLIGRAGFSVRNGFEHIELGFFIGTKWQKKGYAQEACRAVLSYGKNMLGIGDVQALVKEGNTVSEHILEKLGFSLLKTVDVEEDIYGDNYPPADQSGAHRVAVSPARYGRYHLYLMSS